MKKVLVITYYWPPGGGAGVQRWLKFVKYLREFNWEPVVYTPQNPESPVIDPGLEAEIPEGITVLKKKIIEPYNLYKKFVGRKKDERIQAGFLSEKESPSLAENISVWIRGNLFIPDARKFWIEPSIKFLSKWIEKNPVDAIVSTGPPHSMQLIALGLKNKLKLPWLADFRDPWTSIDFYHDLKLTKSSDAKHHRLEKEVLSTADEVVVVSKGMAEDFKAIVPKEYAVITNGFDTELLSETSLPAVKFSVAHIGSLVPARNPENLWKALKEITEEEKTFAGDLELKLVGPVDHSIKAKLELYGLNKYTTFISYLPHDDATALERKTQLLLLIINNTPNARLVVTGKLFEYLNSGRPILCIGPTDGDAAQIISETGTGLVVDFDDLAGMKVALLNFYIKYKNGNLKSEGKNIAKYSRKNLAKKLADQLDAMTSNRD